MASKLQLLVGCALVCVGWFLGQSPWVGALVVSVGGASATNFVRVSLSRSQKACFSTWVSWALRRFEGALAIVLLWTSFLSIYLGESFWATAGISAWGFYLAWVNALRVRVFCL